MEKGKLKINLTAINDGAKKASSSESSRDVKNDIENKEKVNLSNIDSDPQIKESKKVNHGIEPTKISLSQLNSFKNQGENSNKQSEVDKKAVKTETSEENSLEKQKVTQKISVPKISLSQLTKKKDEEKNEKIIEGEEAKVTEKIIEPVKIKPENVVDDEMAVEKESLLVPETEKDKEVPIIPDIDEPLISEIEQTEDITEEPAKNQDAKITIGGIKRAPVEKVAEKPKVVKIDENKEALQKKLELSRKLNEKKIESEKPKPQEKEGALFSNYESNFTKESKSILKSMRKLRYIPKTRLGFIISLIIVTTSSIGILFMVNPDTHSIANYKSSIINSFEEITGSEVNTGTTLTNNNKGIDSGSTEIIVKTNTGKTIDDIVEETEKKDLFYVGGYNYSIKYEFDNDGNKIFIHDKKTFDGHTKLIEYLTQEVEGVKKEKVEDYLKNFYLKSKQKKNDKKSSSETNSGNIITTSSGSELGDKNEL